MQISYEQMLWLMTADRNTGVLSDGVSPRTIEDCHELGLVTPCHTPGVWTLSSAGWERWGRLMEP